MFLIRRIVTSLISVVIALLLAPGAYACAPEHKDCVEQGKWTLSIGVGAGLRTNPLAEGDDIPLFVIPQLSYQGERFFIQNLDIGALLWQNEHHQFNLLATPSYDQVLFERWSPGNFFLDGSTFATAGKNGDEKAPVVESGDRELLAPEFMPLRERELRDRHMAGLAGIEYSWAHSLVELQIQYLTDFTQIHSGEELRIALAKQWRHHKHQWLVSLGANWQSREVINYYYGVSDAEADERGIYIADSAVSPLLRLDWNYEFSEHWDLRMLVSYRQLPDEISASPLMNDNKIITVFVGGVYHF